jgi:hypothetical protein
MTIPLPGKKTGKPGTQSGKPPDDFQATLLEFSR